MNDSSSGILPELRSRFHGLYGPGLERLVLFGSRARGDADPDSDFDVLVVVADEDTIRDNKEPANDIVCALSLEYDTVVSCAFTTREKFERSGMPFYRNVRREGVPI